MAQYNLPKGREGITLTPLKVFQIINWKFFEAHFLNLVQPT